MLVEHTTYHGKVNNPSKDYSSVRSQGEEDPQSRRSTYMRAGRRASLVIANYILLPQPTGDSRATSINPVVSDRWGESTPLRE
ncbi:hypothetical protein MCOR07_005836 [Pyricularia oryzae]|uniref:Uncharacterized protein n=5 Tax=Pyricularia TaxID=48558 RepID=A0ABQ8NZC8_PYRGI|nr:uncharacterized protein MGG_17974 [Pyricularia oryzae 70-15]ELQ36166.1 hypothetical protein OOU_Y34scaffold00666g27 [Pyricularia oryzae Y34]KAH8838288.1 hypothetical protein MCOR01_009732 [Pyricularia oryzae]KAI6304315.1 hypothetical protein MCOR33_000626 [Pyricularia grisea]EHA46256.1 hypothetical protein MGG_17974 [Pyricularia oryzae 70-15]KAI6280937.1 hypothetical protein MCOR26_003512 [Pyricularia oryzae]